MAQDLIDEINRYSCFKFCELNNMVINLKSKEDTNIDEFLDIQNVLNNHRVLHKFESNFEIQIIIER